MQLVRATSECDACGKVVKFDADVAPEPPEGWNLAELGRVYFLCCPDCVEKVSAVLLAKPRAEEAARLAFRANCKHTFMQRGFIQHCSKCGTSK